MGLHGKSRGEPNRLQSLDAPSIIRLGKMSSGFLDQNAGAEMAFEATEPSRTSPTDAELRARLAAAGLRPTRQRLALAKLLFTANRHVTAEGLHEEAILAHMPVSLATVYNALHQFTEAGLLRQGAVDGPRTYFDTNTSEHHHFYVEGEDEVLDISGTEVSVDGLPEAPAGHEIVRVDVVVRLRRVKR